MSRRTLSLVAGLAVIALSIPAHGAVPALINYQGRLTRASGTPLDTTVAITFTIYDSNGRNLWAETHSSVTAVGGTFSVLLGSFNPIQASVFADTSRWLGIRVGTSAEMSPRVRLISVPYSFRVGTVDSASGGTIKGDLVVSGEVSIDGLRLASGASAGKVLTSDSVGKGTWQPGISGPVGPPGPANTLDMAYDQGGPGVGRVIEAEAGPVEVYCDSLQDALLVMTYGDGRAIFAVSQPSAKGDAMTAWTGGEGRALVALSDVSARGDAITAATSGTGGAIFAYSASTAPADVVVAVAGGGGNAGYFIMQNTGSNAAGIVGQSASGLEASAGVKAVGAGVNAPGIPAATALEISNGAIRVTGENKPVGKVAFGPGATKVFTCVEDPNPTHDHVIGGYVDVTIVNALITGSSFIFLNVETTETYSGIVMNTFLIGQTQGSATVRIYMIGCEYDHHQGYVHYFIVNP